MNDEAKSKEELIGELSELRQRIVELEVATVAHQQTDEALRESELKYRDLVDNSLVGIYRTNLEGKILYVNEALTRMLDFDSPEEMMSEGVTVRYKNHKDRERLLGILKEFGKVDNFEFALLTSKGETIQGLLSAVLDGDVLSGMIMNISGRKQAEEALRESEERYSSLFKNNHSVMLLVDPESADIVDANPAACSFYGWGQEELTSMKITDINMLPNEQVFQVIGRAKSEARNHFFFRHCLANEEIRDVEVYSGPISLHGKELLYSIIHDITERKRAEEELRESEGRYRLLVETMNEGMALANQDYVFTYVNESFCKMLGYSRGEMMEHHLMEFLDDDQKELMKDQIDRRKRGEEEPYELVWRAKDGGKIYTMISPRGFFDEAGQFTGGLGVVTDITGRKRSDEELRALVLRLEELEEAERRRLAQELHDSVGQNLTALSINLNFVRKATPLGTNTMASDRLAECLSLVEETAERIRNVMAELRPSVLDDYGLIAALHWYAERFSARTELTTTLLPEQELKVTLPPIVETAIFRIVQEALTNVVKHAKARQVTIQVEEIQGDVRLVVADDGVGFDPKILGQPGGQLGWGLVTMRERATAVGGHLSVNSEPGKGTQVVLEIRG